MAEWSNWAGTASATPARWVRAVCVEDISAAVKMAASAGHTVRALGSGHSFTAAAACDGGAALDLSRFTGIVASDVSTGLVTVRSGTTIRALNATLDGLGVDGKGAHTHYEQMYISSIEPRARPCGSPAAHPGGMHAAATVLA